MPTQTHLLVLDIGSSSLRASLYDANANVVAGSLVREPVSFRTDKDGTNVDDAAESWQRVLRLIAGVQDFCHAQHIQTVQAVCISAYAYSLLGLNAQRQPITPVFTYADTRAAPDARDLREQHDELETLRRTGARIRANYAAPRIRWLQRTQPHLAAQVAQWVSLSDYLRDQATGVCAASLSTASWSGLVHHALAGWDADWQHALGLQPNQLPNISDAGAATHENLAAQFPMLYGAVWLPALGDGAAANIGSGCVNATRIAVTIGTTAAMRIVRPHAPNQNNMATEKSLWRYFVDPARELVGGATSEGGNLFAWLSQTLNISPDANAVEYAISQMQPDTHGLTVLPMLAGERSPNYHEQARATLYGISLDTQPMDIVRACFEAIAFRLAWISDALKPLAHAPAELIASGGALLASRTWQQMIADCSGLPVRVCNEPEATSRGAALLGLLQLGVINNLEALPADLGEVCVPSAEHGTIYRLAMARQTDLYQKIYGRKK